MISLKSTDCYGTPLFNQLFPSDENLTPIVGSNGEYFNTIVGKG